MIIQKNPDWLNLYDEFINEAVPAEHWIPACAGMTKAEVKKFNKEIKERK